MKKFFEEEQEHESKNLDSENRGRHSEKSKSDEIENGKKVNLDPLRKVVDEELER